MLVFLQVWGGALLLLNKICFSRAERSTGKRKERWWYWCWLLNLIGLPAWNIIFILKQDWIAAGVEAGCYISAILGFVIAKRGIEAKPIWLDWIARIATVIGIGYSVYAFGTIFTVQQCLELVLAAGFIVGTYQLANKNPQGYLWYLPMHAASAMLMWRQDVPWLAVQQVISLGFVFDAYFVERRNRILLQPAQECASAS